MPVPRWGTARESTEGVWRILGGGDDRVRLRFRGEGKNRLETFRRQGGVVRQDLLLSPTGAEKPEEEFNRETGTLHHGLA